MDERAAPEWSIRAVTRITKTSSSFLRKLEDRGLIVPSRKGPAGVRYYDLRGLMRLQLVMALADLGYDLAAIRDEVSGQDELLSLEGLMEVLARECDRLAKQRMSIRRTLQRVVQGEPLALHFMFEGFVREPPRRGSLRGAFYSGPAVDENYQ